MRTGVTVVTACLICGGALDPIMSFGRQPIANAFVTPDRFADEVFYELKLARCAACGMVQLGELVDERALFHDAYAFFSGTSRGMAVHFEEMARDVIDRRLGPDPFVVELGSNDGIMLRHFAARGIRHLGVEPSENVAEVARRNGVRTVSRFFDGELAREIASTEGRADVILGANVMCHIRYLDAVIGGIKALLRPEGHLMFEDPYLGDVIEKTAYDQIYDEHVFYFSVGSLANAFARHDMEIVDVEPQAVHGGSMRYTVRHRGAGPVAPSVAAQRERERGAALDRPDTYERFRGNVERSRDELVAVLRDLARMSKRVVGYGATSKSTTVTNYCGIGSDLVEFISDTTPIKQGKYSPGTHIPIRPYAEFQARPPDVALLFAWNHANEILEKEQAFVRSGGRFLVYVPRVGTIP